MPQGLPVSRIVRVTVNLTPLAAQFLNFDTLAVAGSSDVINVVERIRSYGSITEVAADFGTSAPEYTAATLFFGQIPQPSQLYVARWAEDDTAGLLVGSILTAAQQNIALWQDIDDASFNITINGAVAAQVGPVDLSAQTNLNGVASAINASLNALDASIAWDGSRFTVTTDLVGATASVGYATAPPTGTDISGMLNLTTGNATIVDGIDAEEPVDCAVALDELRTSFYGLMFASTDVTDDQHLAVAAFCQASDNPHVYGVTITDTAVLDATITTDLASRAADLDYTRMFCQYSENSYAVASWFGRAFTVDFNGSNTTLTMMFKVEPGVAPASLTSTQANTLQTKRCNVYVDYNNDTSILQYGVMSGLAYFDEIHGLDWLRNRIQTDVFNLLYTTPTKIPQTDPGNNLIANTIAGGCQQGVVNGLMAPGQWNSAGFGQLKQGQFLDKGFYIYQPPISSQPQADREARRSVPFQVAVKLAGAIQDVMIAVNVNR